MDAWETRVQQLEREGLTRSDAQSVADVETKKEEEKMGQVRSNVTRDAYRAGYGTSLLAYTIIYLQDELEAPREPFNVNDGLDIHTLVNDAIAAYNGGAR